MKIIFQLTQLCNMWSIQGDESSFYPILIVGSDWSSCCCKGLFYIIHDPYVESDAAFDLDAGGQICNYRMWRHLVAKLATNSSSATEINFELF